uniref:C-type LECtin n=1 Tax=Caenorhabditis tropicalis TaxID=1561998 RepID=A0A1I7UVS6_9PELO
MLTALLTALLLGSVIQDVTPASLCPDGWTFANETSFCYIISDRYMTYAETDSYCQSLGGSQAFITLTKEQTFLNYFTAGLFAQPWLAITRNVTTNVWHNADGTTVFSTWWSTGEPSLNGNCATYKASNPQGMKATPCYSIQPALCRQMPALCPTTTNYGGLYTRSGTIKSPGYPEQYYNNLDCWYTITAPNTTYITLEFNPYIVEKSFDYCMIYDGPNGTGTYLGKTDEYTNPRYQFESSSNYVSFKFHTDRSITNNGWLLTWNAKTFSTPINQTGYNGSFTSPNYPNNYDPYTEQLYYITAPDGFYVNVTIDDFLTEARFDVLEIYNTSTVIANNLVANLSGNATAPWSWVSPTNFVTMRFKTDGSVQKRGFDVLWYIM